MKDGKKLLIKSESVNICKSYSGIEINDTLLSYYFDKLGLEKNEDYRARIHIEVVLLDDELVVQIDGKTIKELEAAEDGESEEL